MSLHTETCSYGSRMLLDFVDKLAEVKKEAESLGKGKVVVIEADMQKREDLDAILSKTEGLEIDM